MQAALALCAGPEILPSHLPKALVGCSSPLENAPSKELFPGRVQLDDVLAQTEQRLLAWAIEKAKGNQSEAAALLGIPRSTFQYRARRQGLPGAGKES